MADRCLPAAAADIKRKTFGEVRIVRQKIQPFALHCAATTARDAPHFEFQNNPKSCARQVANLPLPPVVPAVPDSPATAANRFFERRSRHTIRTSGSPNTPRTVAFARKPANEYPSDRRRCRFPDLAISQHAKIEPALKPRKSLSTSISAAMPSQNHPLDSLKTQISEEGGVPKVISPIDDTPAAHAGLQPGDLIVSVDGQSTHGMDLTKIVRTLRGSPGSQVTLSISRGTNAPFDVTLTRSTIQVQSVKSKLEPNGIGYLRISEFGGSTPQDLKQAVESMKRQAGGKLRGVVLDLRNDPGGLLSSAVSVAGDFVDGGTIVTVRGRRQSDENTLTAPGNGNIVPGAAIVVLINGASWFRRGLLLMLSPDSRAQRALCQAETPLIVLCRFPEPALSSRIRSVWRRATRLTSCGPGEGEANPNHGGIQGRGARLGPQDEISVCSITSLARRYDQTNTVRFVSIRAGVLSN
jgi:hypothetical protein